VRIGIDARWILDRSSGVGVHTRELIKHLALLDRSNEYVLFFDSPYMREQIVSATGISGARNFTSLLLSFGPYSVWSQLLLPSLLKRLSLDVFHSTDYVVPLLAFPRDPSRGVKCVVTIHDVVPLALPGFSPKARKKRLSPIYRKLMMELGRRADAIITVSNASRVDVTRHLRIPEDRAAVVTTVYNGVASRFRPRESVVPSARGVGTRTVLYVGRSDPYKGLVVLVEAFARLRDACPFPVRLAIAGGKDPRYPEASQRASELGLETSVDWLGYVGDDALVAIYQDADVLVLPSRYEGFGLPVLEAMACGTPVVCSNGGALPEVAGDAALCVNPEDVGGLALAIERVLTDSELRGGLVGKGVRQAARFTWMRMAEATLAVYRDVAATA
jgi:alpha-1,3-rhamnosyl/mannosyltransferase